MSNVNKVKLLSERTSGVPPVIFIFETLSFQLHHPKYTKSDFGNLSDGFNLR